MLNLLETWEDIRICMSLKNKDKEIEKVYILDDLYANREPRLYTECPTLRSKRFGLKVIEEYPIYSDKKQKIF